METQTKHMNYHLGHGAIGLGPTYRSGLPAESGSKTWQSYWDGWGTRYMGRRDQQEGEVKCLPKIGEYPSWQ